MAFFLGVDVGSGSVRAGLFNAKGKLLGSAVSPIEINRPRADFVEQSSDNIWAQTCKVVKTAVKKAGIKTDQVAGIGFDATCSLVALDKFDKPVSVSPSTKPHWNIIMWMDHRAIPEAAEINKTGSEVLKYVGGKVSPEMELPKLLWLKRHLTGQYARTARFFDLADYLVHRACGADVRSVCTKVCKWTYLAHKKQWNLPLFKQLKLDDLISGKKIGARIADIGEKAGSLTPAAAKTLGLNPGIPVAVGMIDAHAGGVGVLGSRPTETLALIGGTSSCHMAVSRKPIFVPGVWGPYFGAMLPGFWLSEGGQSATGALIDHVIKDAEVAPAVSAEAARRKLSVYEVLNEEAFRLIKTEKEPTLGLHVLDYHHGNRSPRANPELRGMVSGLTLNRTKTELARLYLATLQAVAFGTRHIIETMNQRGHGIKRIHICGGGTKNPLFLREHADITGCEIVLSKESEAVLLGSAILAASASGEYKGILDAMKAMTATSRVIKPNAGRKRFLDKKYRVYLEMYEDQMKYEKTMEAR